MKDTKFMTAVEKEMVLKQWKAFIKNGFKFENFTDRIYKHLSLHCSFIAHYDRLGFYETYFKRPEDTVRFLSQFDNDKGNVSVEYGWRLWLTDQDYNDINQAMCDAIEPYKQAIYTGCHTREKNRDIQIAKALLGRHGIEIKTELEVEVKPAIQGELFPASKPPMAEEGEKTDGNQKEA